jgi:threonine dehydratase
MVTPQTEHPEIAMEAGVPRLFFKREDLHPYGSHKGRSIPVMIDIYAAEGSRDFAITGSGNAALAAVRHIVKRNLEIQKEQDKLSLEVILGERVNPEKRQRIMDEAVDGQVTVTEHPRPLQALFAAVKGHRTKSLRQSTDDYALVGYESLAAELSHTPDLAAVFIPASSGTAAQAIAEYFIKHTVAAQVHFVQTGARHPLSETFDALSEGGVSLADAIVDIVAHRKDALIEKVKKTGGRGWTVDNAAIERAQRLIKERAEIDASGNGALALAGLLRARSKGAEFKGAVVCVITGR